MKRLPLLWFLTGTIGDALMALALCRELAELNPGVESTLVVRRDPQLVKDLAATLPSVRVVYADFNPVSLVRIAGLCVRNWQVMSAWKNEGGLRGALRSLFLLNPHTSIVRFDIHKPATNNDAVAPYDMNKLVIDNFRVLAQAVGLKTHPLGAPASLKVAAIMSPSFLELEPLSYIVLHPLGSNVVKSLPTERAHSILNTLAKAHPALSFVITGGTADRAAIEALAASVPRAQAAVGLPILEVAGLIQNSALYIGVDTGITHLAAMMGKKMLALENTDFPRWYPTYNPNTTLLLSTPDSRAGVWGISDAAILAAVAKLIG